MKRIVVVLVWLLSAGTIYSQQTRTLEECRELAIRNNKELKIAGTQIRVAENERKAVFTKYFPEISGTGLYLWNQKNIKLVDFSELGLVGEILPDNVKDFFTLDIHNVWLGGFSLIQPVFSGGRIVNYNHIAAYATELARSMNDLTLQNVLYLTDQAYWQVVSVTHKKQLADAYVELLRQMDRNVTAMIEEGMATQVEGLSVRVKLNEAEVAQTKAENALALSQMLLAQICGLPIEEPFTLADEYVEFLTATPEAEVADVGEAFANRQELKSLEITTRIFKKKEQIAFGEMLPSVGLLANYSVMNPNLQNGFKHEFAGAFHVGVTVSVPITGWWEGTYKRNAAKAETHIARLELEAAKEAIELEVHQSVYKANEAKKKLVASNKNMESAEENLRYATYGFEEGVIPALNLMEAQTAWVSARSELIDSQIEVKLTKVYLEKALGRLTPEEIK